MVLDARQQAQYGMEERLKPHVRTPCWQSDTARSFSDPAAARAPPQAQRCEMDGNPRLRRDGQSQRPVVAVDGWLESLALEQPAYLARHSAETIDGLGELDVVESLGKGRAPCAKPQHEPAGRGFRQAGGEHGDGRRRAPPDVEDPRAEGDPACSRRNLREEHACVMPPAFGYEERVVPESFRAISQVQYDRTSCLHGRQANCELSGGHYLMILEYQPDVQDDTMRHHAEHGVGIPRPTVASFRRDPDGGIAEL